MFTGIIRATGTVIERTEVAERARLAVRSEMFAGSQVPLSAGDSIAVSGVCLTVVDVRAGSAVFDLASETMRRTTLGRLQPEQRVNLERSLNMGQPLDGHLVQGHVDTVVQVLGIEQQANTYRLSVMLPEPLRGMIVPKGAVTLDGVSLTVGEVEDRSFSVYIIPFTWKETTFAQLQTGAELNLEVDCVARYVAGLAEVYFAQRQGRPKL